MSHSIRRTAAVLILLTAVAVVATAQLPDSPTGRAGNAIIKVLSGGPEAATAEFFTEYFSDDYLAEETAEERAEWLGAIIERFGELELQGVQKTAAFGATIMASSATTGSQVEIRYFVQEEEPHRIEVLTIEETGSAIEPMSQEAMVAAVGEYLEQLTTDRKFSGVALVARGEEILFEQAFGLANRRFEVPNQVDTPFNLGSINKIFTKIALGQLAQGGKLSLEDTVAEHLPDYPNPEVATRITIAQVANHTSGLGDIFTDEFAATSKTEFQQPSDYFKLFANDPLLFEPGEGNQYSNGGYMVLGAIIEAVSGQSYHDYIQANILEPAGMTASGPHALDDAKIPMATGYTRLGDDHDAGPMRENTFLIPHTGTSAGGGYSTARDLLAFRHAFVNQKLIDGRYMAWIVSDRLPDEAPEMSPEGLGIGIAGGGPGVNAMLEMDGEWTIVVLTNLDPPSAMDVAGHIRALITAVRKHE